MYGGRDFEKLPSVSLPWVPILISSHKASNRELWQHKIGEMPGCPTCGAELTYLEPYARSYCHHCRAYAPEEIVPCGACGRVLVYVTEHGLYYCYGCQEYKQGAHLADRPCPRCGRELLFVAEYERLFCTRCNAYAPADPQPT